MQKFVIEKSLDIGGLVDYIEKQILRRLTESSV